MSLTQTTITKLSKNSRPRSETVAEGMAPDDTDPAASTAASAVRELPGNVLTSIGTSLPAAGAHTAELSVPDVCPIWVGVKRFLDIIGSAVLLLVLLPVLAFFAALIAADGGKIIFLQQRIGRDGVPFSCFKFRTMVPNAEHLIRDLLEQSAELRTEWQRDHKLRNDPRITCIGGFLRRSSLDELPQLVNVLWGDMSLVGPRPIVKEEVVRYGRSFRWYTAVRPGMTGLWQVSGRNDTDYRRRIALDSYYVRRQSLPMDMIILLRTVQVIALGKGAY